jgi:DNA-binding NtrC family response regulator
MLDELDVASLDVQRLLLSVLEAASIRRLGDATARPLNVRFLAATNRNLDALVAEGQFRPDLLNRVSAVRIRIPPLRERKSDIPILATSILSKLNERFGRSLTLAEDALNALKAYEFPGNLRELTNVLERAVVLAESLSIEAKALSLPTPVPQRRARLGPRVRLELAQRQVESLRRELDALRASTIPAQPIWQGRGFALQHDYCFVLMPFGDVRELQSIYRDHIRVVIERCGFRCERADDIYDVSGVMQSVWEGISKARVVIADLTLFWLDAQRFLFA